MSKGLPELVYPLRLARSGRYLKGALLLAQMYRLADTLYNTAGTVTVDLRFGLGDQGYPVVQGVIKGELHLVCQRCLHPLLIPMTCEMCLTLVSTVNTLEHLDPQYEPLVVQEEEPVSLAAIVEDELILGLPIVPTHPEDGCSTAIEYARAAEPHADTKEGPFAMLRTLKHRLSS